MRIRKKKWVDEELEKCEFLIKNPEEHIGNWKGLFNNERPIYLELGCGKGGFCSKFGIQNGNISQNNYIIIISMKTNKY